MALENGVFESARGLVRYPQPSLYEFLVLVFVLDSPTSLVLATTS